MAASTFNVGGLASGLDTNSIVDKLVSIESLPITKNNQRQAALNVQISSIGDLLSKIKSLSTAASGLSKGVTAYSISSTPAGVSAAVGTGASAATYSVAVGSVATAAKARSGTFNTTNDTVAGGNLGITVKGVAYSVTIAANSDLGSVVQQINQSNAPVRAAVISDGTHFYVSMLNRETGKPIGSGETGGLTIDSDTTGLGMAVTQNASNATLTIDGDLNVESQSNEVSNAIPGVTLTVNAQQTVASNLVIGSDSSKTSANLQGFVDSFNAIVGVLNQSLRPDPKSPPAADSQLDGSTALSLQQQLQRLMSVQASATGSYHTLADVGIKLQTDGTLTLDAATLNKALAKDAGSVDAIFSTAATGISARAADLSKRFTDSVDGALIQRQTSLQKTVKDLMKSNDKLQDYVDAFKLQLQTSFTRMESLISSYKTIGTFLSTNSAFGSTSG
jgi:flagellar hook-associated protein 2